MDKLGKWAKGKSQFYINAMICFADLSNYIYKLTEEDYFKSLRELGITNIPEIEIWLDYYREYKLTEDEWNVIINKQGEVYKVLIRFIIGFAKQNNAPIDEFAEQLKGISDELYELLRIELKNELPVKDFRETRANLGIDDINNNPGILFFVRVIMPCHFLYGELPSELYRKAKEGDLKSFCKLLRIDKTIICDQNLAEYIKQMDIYRRRRFLKRWVMTVNTISDIKKKYMVYPPETKKVKIAEHVLGSESITYHPL